MAWFIGFTVWQGFAILEHKGEAEVQHEGKVTLSPEGSWWFLSCTDGTHAQFSSRSAAEQAAIRMQALNPALIVEVRAVDGRLEGRITPAHHEAMTRR